MNKMLKKNLVLPGDFLTTEEEFLPGKNTFSDDGTIYSDSSGEAVFNQKEKKVSVEKKREVLSLDIGSIVYARVMLVKKSAVLVDIIHAEKDNMERVISNSNASIPVRNVSRDYVKSLNDYFKIGDIVKAKVSFTSEYAIDLRTNEPDLGVVNAFCSKCRHSLHSFGSKLKCTSCGNTEQRKLSKDYVFK